MSVSLIAAVAENRAIGKDNQLLCRLSDDLKRFKKITSGHTIIMGKKTFESLPNGALPNRHNIVLTDRKGEKIPGCQMAYSIQEALQLCEREKENFVIGGGSVYQQFLPHADKLYITAIHQHFEADTFFPEIAPENWKLISDESHPADEKNHAPFSFRVYQRIKT